MNSDYVYHLGVKKMTKMVSGVSQNIPLLEEMCSITPKLKPYDGFQSAFPQTRTKK